MSRRVPYAVLQPSRAIASGRNAVLHKLSPRTFKFVIRVWQNATRPLENPIKQHLHMRNISCCGRGPMALRRESGFSLIELMVVGAVIGVLAAISVPAIAGAIKMYAVITASQQVASAIRSARVQAVGKNKVLHVHFEAAAGTFQVLDDANAPVGSLLSLPSGTLFVDADTDIEFDTSGRLDPALAPISVVVGNGDAEHNRTLTVTTSGRVQLP